MHVVVIGNGIAGNTAVSVIRKLDLKSRVSLISDEEFSLYSAPILANYISGELARDKVFLKSSEDYSNEGIQSVLGKKVTAIDLAHKNVIWGNNEISYDKLIIATGSRPVLPPIDGIYKEGVLTFKSLSDADRIARFTGKVVAIIGAGFVGVEAAVALRKRGWHVHIISRRWLLPRVFDEKPSFIVKEIMEQHGINVLTREQVIRIDGNGHVGAVVTDKRRIKCDLVILAAGMRPEVKIADRAGIKLGNLGGVKTDSHMMTSAKDVYACGDCVQTRSVVTGEDALSLLWHNAKAQGSVAGHNCVGASKCYSGSLNITSFHVFGKHVVSIGHTCDSFVENNVEVVEERDAKHYHRLLLRSDHIVGAQFIGNTDHTGPIVAAIKGRDTLEKLRRLVSWRFISRNPWRYSLDTYLP